MSASTFSDRMGTIRPAPVSFNRATLAALVRGPARHRLTLAQPKGGAVLRQEGRGFGPALFPDC
jgi:hypothetical protein